MVLQYHQKKKLFDMAREQEWCWKEPIDHKLLLERVSEVIGNVPVMEMCDHIKKAVEDEHGNGVAQVKYIDHEGAFHVVSKGRKW